jgi:hypothetical protein
MSGGKGVKGPTHAFLISKSLREIYGTLSGCESLIEATENIERRSATNFRLDEYRVIPDGTRQVTGAFGGAQALSMMESKVGEPRECGVQ